jgi:hypothetical protein
MFCLLQVINMSGAKILSLKPDPKQKSGKNKGVKA